MAREHETDEEARLMDPRTRTVIHSCNTCQKSIYCNGECRHPATAPYACAVCAGKSPGEK